MKVLKVGVSLRLTGRGMSHVYDVQSVLAMNHLPGISGKFMLVPVALPAPADGPNNTVKRAKAVPVMDDIKDIHMIYLPGDDTANDTQTGINKKDRNYKGAKSGFQLQEHDERCAYELKLLSLAVTRGIPIIAVCGGVWRLLESFGGKVRTLPKDRRGIHTSSQNTWQLKQDLFMPKAKTMLASLAKGALAESLNYFLSISTNSTHWAVADTDQVPSVGGRMPNLKNIQKNHRKNVNDLLEITALGGDVLKGLADVEAFESKLGAPVLGLQWHPETYLPGMPGFVDASEDMKRITEHIFTFVLQAAAAAKARSLFARGFNKNALK